MATQPLMTDTVQAKPVRTAFDAAMAQLAAAQASALALAPGGTIHDDIAAGAALERARAALAEVPSPNLRAFGTKLRVTLEGAGVDAALIDRLTGDARRLAQSAEAAA